MQFISGPRCGVVVSTGIRSIAIFIGEAPNAKQLSTPLPPFHRDSHGDAERCRVGDVLQRVDDLGPQVHVDWGAVRDELEALLEGVLQDGDGVEEGVERAKHHDQLWKGT